MLGNLKVARELLRRGAAMGATNERGSTPLHWAASRGHIQVIASVDLSTTAARCSDTNTTCGRQQSYIRAPLSYGLMACLSVRRSCWEARLLSFRSSADSVRRAVVTGTNPSVNYLRK